jgi:DNA-binding transcriptional LysR family regulator
LPTKAQAERLRSQLHAAVIAGEPFDEATGLPVSWVDDGAPTWWAWSREWLGLKVVAEGVEEADQAVRLVEHGIEQAQGWLWSLAVSANDAMELVRRLPLPMPSAPRGTATTTHPPVSARPVKSSIVR